MSKEVSFDYVKYIKVHFEAFSIQMFEYKGRTMTGEGCSETKTRSVYFLLSYNSLQKTECK